MPPILHVLADLGPDGPARQLAALLPRLEEAGWASHVAVLREPGFEAPRFCVPTEELPDRHGFDPRGWLAVRCLVRELRPTVVHAWGSRALSVVDPVTRWLAGPPV